MILVKYLLPVSYSSSPAVAHETIYYSGNDNHRKWKLAKDDLDYHYSSARFYENGTMTLDFYTTCTKFLMAIERAKTSSGNNAPVRGKALYVSWATNHGEAVPDEQASLLL